MNSRHLISNILCLVCSFGIHKSKYVAEDFTINTTEFYIVSTLPSYIDKTWFIHDLLTLPRHLAVSGPKGFSKSTNLNTLKAFLELELDENNNAINPRHTQKLPMFQNQKIFSDKTFFWRHFALRPVIHLDLRSVNNTTNFDEFLKSFEVNCIKPLVSKFNYVINSSNIPDWKLKKKRKLFSKDFLWTNTDLSNFPATLVDFLSQHHSTKAVVLIDNYDYPISKSYLDPHITESDSDEIMEFIERLVTMVTKQRSTYLLFLTGILGIELEGALKLHYETIFDSLYSSYGFLESDLEILGNVFELPPDEVKILKMYHGGYRHHETSENDIFIRNPKIRMYNTYSIVTYLQSKQSSIPFGGVDAVIPLLTHNKCGPRFEHCVLDECHILVRSDQWVQKDLLQLKISLYPESRADCDLVLRLFADNGFFSAKISHELRTLSVPNFEVKVRLMDYLYKSSYLKDRYGYSERDERRYVLAMENLGENVATLKDVVISVQNLFRKMVPEGEEFMQPVLFYPLDAADFASYQIQKYTSSSSNYDIFVKRKRDSTGILFKLRCKPDDLGRAVEEMKKSPPSDGPFDMIPGLKDSIELRLVVTAENRVFGFYNYTRLDGKSICGAWQTKDNSTLHGNNATSTKCCRK
ncbi:uncharacterized protein [Bemisia tabaci]|uniref:uncharacterized protein isoform X1 n=1 Tax=Bemisia tabaci TaxID=7038 RepID=UPI003B27D3BA